MFLNRLGMGQHAPKAHKDKDHSSKMLQLAYGWNGVKCFQRSYSNFFVFWIILMRQRC